MRCSMRVVDGRPSIEVDGRPVLPLLYSTSFLAERQVRLFRDIGVDLVSFPCTADFHLYHLAKTTWTAPDVRDYSELDARMALVMKANPNAYLLPRVFLCSPPWWDDAHPEELVHWDDGSTGRPLFHGAAKSTVPSLGSDVWQAAMRENLGHLVRHVESGPYGDRVLGYMVNSLNSEEWFHWGTMEGYLFDYHPGVARRFREWLRVHYAGDEEALGTAWNRRITFDDVAIPTPQHRREIDARACRDPHRHRDAVDFSFFFGDLVAETIIDLARVVKSTTAGAKCFGTFYGYLVELAYHPDGIQNGGHLGLGRVLEAPEIDFLAAPSSYARRLPGDGYSMSMGPSFSVNRSGKVFFHENDIRTNVLHDDAGYGRCDTAFETCAIQRREFAHAVTHGHGMWWFDMTSGWYDSPELESALEDIVAIARGVRHLERKSVSEVAVVLDEESMPWVSAPPNQFVQLLPQQCLELSRIGAPFEVARLQDLEKLRDMKLLLLPQVFHADEAKRRRIHEHLESTGATAIWFVAPGMIDGETVDLAHSERLTGIRLAHPPTRHFAAVDATIDGRRTRYGTNFWFAHLPMIDDESAEILGRYVPSGLPALARKSIGCWTSVVSGAPALGSAVLAVLADRARVHRYVETDDAIYACSRLVALHARSTGTKDLRIPGTESIYDIARDVEIPSADGAFSIYVPKGETIILYRGSREAWRRADQDLKRRPEAKTTS